MFFVSLYAATPPSRGLHVGGLRLIATVQKCEEKEKKR